MSLQLETFTISYYAICLIISIITGYILILKRLPLYKLSTQLLENLAIICVPASIIGARIYHILSELGYYRTHLNEIFALKLNGLGLFGVIFASVTCVYIYSKFHRLNFLKLLDAGSLGLMLGQIIGRFGNYFNKELYGYPTNLPWKIFIPLERRVGGFENFEYFHPTFLYESVWNLIGLIMIFRFEKKLFQNKKYKPGLIFASYLIWYGFGRFFLGFLRVEERDFWILNDGQIGAIIALVSVFFMIKLTRTKFLFI